jgi:transcriptional regulator with XRE-family HTH domain
MDVQANEQLRGLVRQAGLTYEKLARLINRVAAESGEVSRANKSSVSHWINGVTPQPRTIVHLCEALSRILGRHIHPTEGGYGDAVGGLDALPDDPLDALARLGRADVNRRDMLASAVYSLGALLLPVGYKRELQYRAASAADGRIGLSEVEVVADITSAFNRADEKLGGGFGRSAVVEYLTTDVATYCRAQASGPVRSAMLSAASQLAYLAGWKAHDIGKEGLAQRYYLHSYQLAEEAGELGQASYVMRILAHQAYDMGHSSNCVDLASASVRLGSGKVDPHTHALLVLTLAKAYAMAGDRRATMATISEAEAILSRAQPDEERPGWAGMHGLSPAQFNNHVAKILADLGDHKGAEEHFSRSLWHHLDPVAQPRIYALTSAWLAEAQCRQGHVEKACVTWSDAFGRMAGIQSSRTQEAVRSMRGMLSPYRRKRIPAVEQLLQASYSPS